jgi:hypothetical protein
MPSTSPSGKGRPRFRRWPRGSPWTGNGEGRLLGIEILDASKRLADPEALRRFALEALPVLR